MKIAFYNVTASFMPGGLETYCWEVGRELVRRGHEVTIFAGQARKRGTQVPPLPLPVIFHRYPEVELLTFAFRIEGDWPNLGTRFRRLMERLSFARHSMGALIAGGYDAVIVNKPFDFPILHRARAKGLKAKTLFRSGGTDFFLGDRLFAGAIDLWVSSSRYNAAQVESRYGRRVTVIHNGVDTERFAGAERAARHGLFRLVSVGRLVGWKGLRIVIESLPALPARVQYLVVGEGPERPALEALAKSLGVADRVVFAGRVPHDRLPGLLATCDALVQPSIGEEAFGISVVEAMASGLPALVSDQGGLPEIVNDELVGLRLPPGNLDAWRAAIAALASDPERARRLGVAARARACEHFTWAANAARHEALLEGSA